MRITERIESLQKKPKHVRDRYAFWVAVSFTLCVVGIWTTTLSPRIAVLRDGGKQLTDADSVGTWSKMTASVKNGWSSVTHPQAVVPPEVRTASSTIEATSTESQMVWTEAAKAALPVHEQEGRMILIGTSSAATTSSSTNVLQ